MTFVIIFTILGIINGMIIGYLFLNLKSDIVSLHLMNKLFKEDNKKIMQDFQLKFSDKTALLDAKLTRILMEMDCEKVLTKNKKRRGKTSPPSTKSQVVLAESIESYPQT